MPSHVDEFDVAIIETGAPASGHSCVFAEHTELYSERVTRERNTQMVSRIEVSTELPPPPQLIQLSLPMLEQVDASQHEYFSAPVPPVSEPVTSNVFRRLVDNALTLESSEALMIRQTIRDGQAVPEGFRSGLASFKYACIKISERKPFLLVAGLLGWIYLVVYTLLKATILV